MLRATATVVYALSFVAAGWWTYAWPLLFEADPASSVLRTGCLATLWLWLGSLALLVALRARARRARVAD